jgi:predicted dinucleotide-binding enzyme
MKISVLGTGGVGQTIGTRLVRLGHAVTMGSRSAQNAKGLEWVEATGAGASLAAFREAAQEGELAFNCTSGRGSVEAMQTAAPALVGKIVIDVANPLDFSQGFPPFLYTTSQDSLGEQLQRALPESKVVKALNHVTASVMVDPQKVAGGDHDALICGNDPAAKAQVAEWLKQWFGWSSVLDLGDISAARGMEAHLTLWVRLMGSLGTAEFGTKIVK